jgi:hypothetical protein
MAADDRPERHCDHIIYLGDGTALWFWAYFRDLSVKGATILTGENRYQWCNRGQKKPITTKMTKTAGIEHGIQR